MKTPRVTASEQAVAAEKRYHALKLRSNRKIEEARERAEHYRYMCGLEFERLPWEKKP